MDVADIRIEKWEDIDTWTSSRLPSLGLIWYSERTRRDWDMNRKRLRTVWSNE
jgi:hypothetical protein